MTEKGMIFTGESIRAMLEHRKTVTRRVMKIQPEGISDEVFLKNLEMIGYKSPYQVGDLLYARETWATLGGYHHEGSYQQVQPIYRATWTHDKRKWKSAMFMFKEYARIWREIVGVRPERLQEISQIDIYAEGCPLEKPSIFCDPADGYERRVQGVEWFALLWDSVNPRFPWASNPYIWRIEFKEMVR